MKNYMIRRGTKLKIMGKPGFILTVLSEREGETFLILDVFGNLIVMAHEFIEQGLNTGYFEIFNSKGSLSDLPEEDDVFYISNRKFVVLYVVEVVLGCIVVIKDNEDNALGYFVKDFNKLIDDGIILDEEEQEEKINFEMYLVKGNIEKDIIKARRDMDEDIIFKKGDQIMDNYLIKKGKIENLFMKNSIKKDKYESEMAKILYKYEDNMKRIVCGGSVLCDRKRKIR